MSDEHIFHEKPEDDGTAVDELSEDDLLEICGGAPSEPTSPILDVNTEQVVFTSVSNVLKTRHDTAKNSISN